MTSNFEVSVNIYRVCIIVHALRAQSDAILRCRFFYLSVANTSGNNGKVNGVCNRTARVCRI